MSDELIKALDKGCRELGYTRRTDFVREAIREKLIRNGQECPEWMIVGGKPTPKYPVNLNAALVLADKKDAADLETSSSKGLPVDGKYPRVKRSQKHSDG